MAIEWKAWPRLAAEAIVACSVRSAWAVLVGALLLTVVAGRYTASHIAIDTDTGNMLDPDLPHRRASRALQAAFPRLPGDVVLFTESAHAGDAEDAADAAAKVLGQRPDIAHGISQPGGGEFFARNGLLYLDTDELWSLSDRLSAAQPVLGALARNPSLAGLLEGLTLGLASDLEAEQQRQLAQLFDRISSALESYLTGHGAALHWRDELLANRAAQGPQRSFVLIDPALEDVSFRPDEAALDGLHKLVAALAPQFPGVTFEITGSSAMDGEELGTVASDATLTTSASFAAVAVVLLWGLSAIGLSIAVLVTLACGLIWTAAFATFWVGSLNLISVCFAVLFIGMGVDFGIQFAMRYREEVAHLPDRGAALRSAASGAGNALILAAVGAAISFFAFVPTSYLGLAQLGVIAGFSMVVALLANLVVLPALLSRLRAPRALARADHAGGGSILGRVVARARWPILVAAAVAAVSGIALLPRAEFDLNPLNLKDPHTASVRAFHTLASSPDSSPYSADVLAVSRADAEARAQRLRALPLVDHVLTLSSFVPDGQSEKLEIIDGIRASVGAALAGPASAPPTPAVEAVAIERVLTRLEATAPATRTAGLGRSSARLAAALRALGAAVGWPGQTLPAVRALVLGDLPQVLARLRGLLAASTVSEAELPNDLRQRYIAADGRARIEVFPREDLNDNAAMRRFAAAVSALEPGATGAPLELVAGSQAVIDACITASTLALVLTVLMHAFVLSGVLDAALVAAPLVLAMLLTVATSVVFHIPFNFANIIALPLLIGLNNAYGAYLVMRRKHAAGVGDLLDSSTPRAVLFSGLTAIASFGMLAFSQHPGMAGMGLLISLSLGYALLCALLVLPALMSVLERGR